MSVKPKERFITFRTQGTDPYNAYLLCLHTQVNFTTQTFTFTQLRWNSCIIHKTNAVVHLSWCGLYVLCARGHSGEQQWGRVDQNATLMYENVGMWHSRTASIITSKVWWTVTLHIDQDKVVVQSCSLTLVGYFRDNLSLWYCSRYPIPFHTGYFYSSSTYIYPQPTLIIFISRL